MAVQDEDERYTIYTEHVAGLLAQEVGIQLLGSGYPDYLVGILDTEALDYESESESQDRISAVLSNDFEVDFWDIVDQGDDDITVAVADAVEAFTETEAFVDLAERVGAEIGVEVDSSPLLELT